MDFTDAVSEFIVFLIRIVFSIVLPRDENRGGLLCLRNPLCCAYTGNRIHQKSISPILPRHCDCFHGGDPLCAEAHGWIIGGTMVNTGKKFIGPLFVVLLLPWFSDTIEGILYMVRLSVYDGQCRESFRHSDPWCRCSSDSAASRGFSYGPVADVQWLMRDSWNPPVFPVGCFPFFFVQYPLSYGEGHFISSFANLSVG